MNSSPQQPRLPQIDPVTFDALNTLDHFLARAPLTRGEHAEASRSLHHLVQTIESLQFALKELGAQTSVYPFSQSEMPASHPPHASNGSRISSESQA